MRPTAPSLARFTERPKIRLADPAWRRLFLPELCGRHPWLAVRALVGLDAVLSQPAQLGCGLGQAGQVDELFWCQEHFRTIYLVATLMAQPHFAVRTSPTFIRSIVNP